MNQLFDPTTFPNLLLGDKEEALTKGELVFESIIKDGRAEAEVHWLFKADQANGASAAIIKYLPGGSVPPHFHNGHELIFVLDGEMITSTGTVKKNDLVLLKPGSSHSSSCEIGCLALILWMQSVSPLLEVA